MVDRHHHRTRSVICCLVTLRVLSSCLLGLFRLMLVMILSLYDLSVETILCFAEIILYQLHFQLFRFEGFCVDHLLLWCFCCTGVLPSPRCGHTLNLTGAGDSSSRHLVVAFGETTKTKERKFFNDVYSLSNGTFRSD